MKSMKRLFAIMLALLLVLSGCASGGNKTDGGDTKKNEDNGADKGSIKIACIVNTTGDYAQYGIPIRDAAKLYFDQLNAKGGINGKKVEMLEYDDRGDSAETVNAFNLAIKDGATAILGSALTAPTIALADASYDAGVPQITASATSPAVTLIDPDKPDSEIRSNVFRACFIDPYQGIKMAHYAVEKLGAKTAGVLSETGNDYSEGVKAAFIEEAKKLGLEIIGTEAYGAGDKDFRAQMTNLANAKPDVIFLPIYYTEAGLAITAARSAGYKGTFMGSDGFGSIKDYASKEDLEGTVYCSGYAMGSEMVAQFEKDFKEATGHEVPNMFAPLSYDAAMLLAEGLKKAEEAGLEPQTDEYYQKVIEGIREVKDLKGITGSYSFDKYNNPIKDAAIIELKDGQEVFKEMF